MKSGRQTTKKRREQLQHQRQPQHQHQPQRGVAEGQESISTPKPTILRKGKKETWELLRDEEVRQLRVHKGELRGALKGKDIDDPFLKVSVNKPLRGK